MGKILKVIVVIMVLSIQANIYGQTITSVIGNVLNTKKEVVLGNALIISPLDSTIITGTTFFEGKFELTNLNERKILLKLTSLEFKDTFITIDFKGISDIDLGDIIVDEASNALEEVVLVANLPLFETKNDGTVQVNVENTVLATSNSVQEILSRSPNVLVEDEGISIIGKGTAIIYLNGQRIFSEQLANVQASEIKNIEIISNPSAKYDAEGQAVINIVTSTSTMEGIKGMLSQNVSVSDFSPTNTNTNFNFDYRRNRISITGNYGMQLGAYRFLLNTTRNRSEEGDFFNSDITTDWVWDQKFFANYGVGVQYNFSDESYLSIGYNGLNHALGGTESSNNDIVFNDVLEQFESVVNKDDLTTQNAFVLNYFQSLDSLGSSLYFGGQYSRNNTAIDDIIDEESISEGQISRRTLKNLVDREIPIYSARLDFTKVFSEKGQLETGIKFGSVQNTSDSDFLVSTNETDFTLDEALSREFEYNEQIYAAYINYSKNVSEKVNYNFGLRSELTEYELATDNLEAPIKDDYLNLFPNASIGIVLNENKSFFASYASRIARPRYESLNPTIIYQDAFTSIQGNPNIVPEKIHAFEIGANLRKITLKLGYNYTLDPITGGAVQGEDPKSYILQRLNSNRQHDVFANAILPFNTDWWTSMNSVTVSYNKLIDTQSSFGFKETRPQAYLYTNNKFTLFEGMKLQLIAWYLSNRYDGIYFRKNQAEITLGLEKDFFNNSLKLQVVANDIFQTNKPDGDYRLGNTLILFDRINNTRYVRFMATYNFGKLKKTNYQRKSTGDEENNRL
ncbi:outer membrane beta-barrel family protein [Flagellimonas sp. HMM57]|uniref:outer membrane beta-barrel family protein n=1 Tax=unclassified Flagellimonas TaxID=2644544 RepID=UPI0013D58708|nr:MULTISPECIES: outer membrane beta-barrel family protein [unclassified Flagellimonas]UII74740.1 outer membrane beta-barrel family protein [Flagellimonas sp. HMM57]